MQSLSLKTNQQTEKLALLQFIPVSKIQRESEYIVYKLISHLTGNFANIAISSHNIWHIVHSDKYVGVKERNRKNLLPKLRTLYRRINIVFYGTYPFETHFVFFILARCCCCFWAGRLFTWPDLLGFGARVCTLSSQVLRSKVKKVTLGTNKVMSLRLPNIKNCLTTGVEP